MNLLNEYIQTMEKIKFIKDTFEVKFSKKLNLTRVSAPMFVTSTSCLNDNLNGFEEPVKFNVKSLNKDLEIVQSLAKWKRMALEKYNFNLLTGLYTDMNAIRKDEVVDNIHSIYVDQWDWEKVIRYKDRNCEFLFETVRNIYSVIFDFSQELSRKYDYKYDLKENIFIISTDSLESIYPTLTPKEREYEITKLHKAVFIFKIGYPVSDGNPPHDTRAADYDDWLLNGDILLYHEVLDIALEISSMGIRVSEDSLVRQLEYKNELHKLSNPYCQDIINKKLPYSIGGGIGQSRLCMFYMQKKHIGEVQASIFNDEEELKKQGINLL